MQKEVEMSLETTQPRANRGLMIYARDYQESLTSDSIAGRVSKLAQRVPRNTITLYQDL